MGHPSLMDNFLKKKNNTREYNLEMKKNGAFKFEVDQIVIVCQRIVKWVGYMIYREGNANKIFILKSSLNIFLAKI